MAGGGGRRERGGARRREERAGRRLSVSGRRGRSPAAKNGGTIAAAAARTPLPRLIQPKPPPLSKTHRARQADKSKQLSWECLRQALTFQRQASNDIRLNVRLFRACVNDQRRFCADVEPGHWRVQVRRRAGALKRGRAVGARQVAARPSFTPRLA